MSIRQLRPVLVLALVPLATGCAGSGDSGDDSPTCQGSKCDADDVSAAIERLTLDGELDADDVRELFDEAGGNVSEREMLLIRDAVESSDYTVTEDAVQTARDLARLANLFDSEIDSMTDAASPSYGGHEIPEAVRELVAMARLNGANAYDVREEDDGGGLRWTHYLPTAPDSESTALIYTEITPDVLKADMADTDVEYNVYLRTENNVAVYEPGKGGTGNVLSHYDEAYHPDIYARGRSGQKWANNCAILSDGSLHCLPAMRRSEYNNAILTNPDLSRCAYQDIGAETSCKHLLYNGHVDIRGNVVRGVEVSGVPSKRVAEGKDKLIDPLLLLEAWGFEIAPGVNIRWGNTSEGTPVRNLERGIIEAPPAP